MCSALERIRSATAGTPFEGRLYLVGGIVRDQVMGVEGNEDVDLVLEGDAIELAKYLHQTGVSEHPPVVYPRFGTAMLTVHGTQVELVTARSESYDRESRKPDTRPAPLLMDVLRRDFTINTLLRNLHTGELLDLTGKAMADIRARIVRTPLDPLKTFDDDPLRMLRAIRFAARLDFEIEPETYQAIAARAPRLAIISKERIRDELSKTLMTAQAGRGLQMLLETGLLVQFAPELAEMRGVEQNKYHLHDCWTHTLATLDALPLDSSLIVRLAALFHDIGKPETKTFDDQGEAHFYGHQNVGATTAARVMRRLRFSREQIDSVRILIQLHLRPGAYNPNWSDSAVRRLIREAGSLLDELLTLSKADTAASNPDLIHPDYPALEARIAAVKADMDVVRVQSPLNGDEIMRLLHIPPGPKVREVKEFLLNEVIEGRLRPDDKDAAREAARRAFGS